MYTFCASYAILKKIKMYPSRVTEEKRRKEGERLRDRDGRVGETQRGGRLKPKGKREREKSWVGETL